MQQIAIGVKEAAARLGVSHWAVRQWIKQGKLRAVRLGRRVLIEPAELERLVEQGRTEVKQ
ncbi:MAG: helix-turn-helix domain-containing protein [Acidobacteriia bacterium]|nr:helix-turn-helix domain-containing protein [Terriglobia bacterium]